MPPASAKASRCGGSKLPDDSLRLELPVLAAKNAAIPPSRMSRRRAAVLIGVHVLILGHIVHWLVSGRTVSPVEPSEAMYTLDQGYVNAGFIFFAVSILATLIFGRFFCGWGCHLVAYQDFCGWLLRKAGLRPKPFRSRILVFAPLALALYMFVWPTAYRLVAGHEGPRLTNHLVTSEFWKTFPGPGIAVLTFAVCGFVIVYFLGNKGFCTYACPYGGFFGLADKFARGRIRVTEDCEHCGHCTATCSSNVRVHEEVALFGMVVDPGCMKCMDCVSVCPNDALYFSLSPRPARGNASGPSQGLQPARRRGRENASFPSHSPNHQMAKSSNRSYDFTFAEELLMVVIGVGSLLAYRGLYNKIPLLLAMGMAGITAFLVVKLLRLATSSNVRLQNLQLKTGGRIRGSGVAFAAGVALLLVFVTHSVAVQYSSWRGSALYRSLDVGDEVWLAGDPWWQSASPDARDRAERAAAHLSRVDRWGLFPTPTALLDLVWLHLAKGDTASAEATVRRLIELMPEDANVHRGLAGVLRKGGRLPEAETAYREALRLDPAFDRARLELAALLIQSGRPESAVAEYREALKASPHNPRFVLEIAGVLSRMGRFDEAIEELQRFVEAHPNAVSVWSDLGSHKLRVGRVDGLDDLRRAVQLEPSLVEPRYNLAVTLLAMGEGESLGDSRVGEAIALLASIVADRPEFAEAHYNLGVAKFMAGSPEDAIPHVRESLRLTPDDPQAKAFLAMLTGRTAP